MGQAGSRRVVPVSERRAAMFLLISLAMTDGRVEDREMKLLQKAALRFGCQLKPEHFKNFHITKCIDEIKMPVLRRMLLLEMMELGQCDGLWEDKEKSIVAYAAKTWGLKTPSVPELDWDSVPDFIPEGQGVVKSLLAGDPEALAKIMTDTRSPAVEFSYFRVVKYGDTLLVGSPLGQNWRNIIGAFVLLGPVVLSLSCAISHVLSTEGWLVALIQVILIFVIFVPGLFAFGLDLISLTHVSDLEISKGPEGTVRMRRGDSDDSKIEIFKGIEKVEPPRLELEDGALGSALKYELELTLKNGESVHFMKSGADQMAVQWLGTMITKQVHGEDAWAFIQSKVARNQIFHSVLYALAILTIIGVLIYAAKALS